MGRVLWLERQPACLALRQEPQPFVTSQHVEVLDCIVGATAKIMVNIPDMHDRAFSSSQGLCVQKQRACLLLGDWDFRAPSTSWRSGLLYRNVEPRPPSERRTNTPPKRGWRGGPCDCTNIAAPFSCGVGHKPVVQQTCVSVRQVPRQPIQGMQL